jgi:hypothetical protein
MTYSTLVVGSLAALRASLEGGFLGELAGGDAVVVPTAAAFTGAAEATIGIADALEGTGLRLEGLMVTDRPSADEPHFARRVAEADLVILTDGSALHARTVWRATPFGEALRNARALVAIGSVATVLGDVMIDPRGGAPTTGLGYRPGIAICARESDDLLDRTRSLLKSDVTLAVIGPMGVLGHDGNLWRVVVDDVAVTRGQDYVNL